eukprot:TRINITY_DN29606_c0_g2_i1.p1 TRINITY_DN29606_c0_g2~~TRINITY_DN29606_c0_g2_i1.p1  ORF type:complete len:568 (-),score=43.02 TRINITY_DN29606_c0_g2_i1:235-1809(-)
MRDRIRRHASNHSSASPRPESTVTGVSSPGPHTSHFGADNTRAHHNTQCTCTCGALQTTNSHQNTVTYHGSTTATYYVNDVHMYDIANNRWEQIETRGEGPAPREFHAVTYHCNALIVVGGKGEGGTNYNDIYQLALQTCHWRKIHYHQSVPIPPRCGHTMTTLLAKNATEILLKQKIDERPFIKNPSCKVPVLSLFVFGGLVGNSKQQHDQQYLNADPDNSKPTFTSGTGGTYILNFSINPAGAFQPQPQSCSLVRPAAPPSPKSPKATHKTKLNTYRDMMEYAQRFYYSTTQSKQQIQEQMQKVSEFDSVSKSTEGVKSPKKLNKEQVEEANKRFYEMALSRQKATAEKLYAKYFANKTPTKQITSEEQLKSYIDRFYTNQVEAEKQRQAKLKQSKKPKTSARRLYTKEEIDSANQRLYTCPLEKRREVFEELDRKYQLVNTDKPYAITPDEVDALVFRLTGRDVQYREDTSRKLAQRYSGPVVRPAQYDPREIRQSVSNLYYKQVGLDPPPAPGSTIYNST